MKTLSQIAHSLPEKINWFPGHMYKSSQDLINSLSSIDYFLEIRDARVPFSSKNFELDAWLTKAQKKKVIIFNKFDLCNQRITSQVISSFNKIGIVCYPVSATLGSNIVKILNFTKENTNVKYNTVGLWLMIGGMPNVGKSTILNTLRRKVASESKHKTSIAATSPLPGTTKNVNSFRISDNPLSYMVDSPGLMVPRIIDNEVGLKLSLLGCIKDTIVNKEVLVNYLLLTLNAHKVFTYVSKYKLEKPVDTGPEFFFEVREKHKQFNYDTTYDMILKDFREGALGKITLDEVPFEELL